MSNLGQTQDDYASLGTTYDRAQGFTTGDSAAGYTLTGIDLNLRSENTGTSTPTVTLHVGSATGMKVADLTGPSMLTAGTSDTYAFTPAGAVRLRRSTDYWVVAQGGSADVDWETAFEDAEDATPASGWSIANDSGRRSAASTGAFETASNILRLSVRGVVRVPPPNAVASGVPAITALSVFRVPALLTADITGITDGNGIEEFANSVTYNWQRFDAGGSTLEADAIGTGSTYILEDADAGKTLKVQVSFTDDDGYA